MIFDSIAVRLDSDAVAGEHVIVNWEFPDRGEKWVLGLEHQTLHHVRGRHDADAHATIRLDSTTLVAALTGATYARMCERVVDALLGVLLDRPYDEACRYRG